MLTRGLEGRAIIDRWSASRVDIARLRCEMTATSLSSGSAVKRRAAIVSLVDAQAAHGRVTLRDFPTRASTPSRG